MRRGTLILVLLAALVFPLAAQATSDPLGGGSSKLQLDQGFRAFLHRDGIRLTPAEGAALRGGAVVLAVSGGSVDPTVGRGKVELSGSVIFGNARQRVPLRRITVQTTRSPLVAKVGGSQLKVARAGKVAFRRRGFDSVLLATKLRLTAKVATRLNKKLRPPLPFAAGQLVGELRTTAQPLLTHVLPTGRARIVLDPRLVAKLDRLFVAVNPVFPAEHLGAEFTLPIIAKGALAPDASVGVLRTGGEMEFLKLGGGQVFWREPWFDLGAAATLAEVDAEPTPAFPGKLGQVPILAQGAGAVSSDPGARTIGLSGVPLSLDGSMAALFNQAFADGGEEFQAGEPVGVLSFTAKGQ